MLSSKEYYRTVNAKRKIPRTPPDFSRRSYAPELLDDPDIPFADIKRNMQELEFINTHLGGHAITTEGILSLMSNRKQVHICEIGCGGGDNLKAIEKYLSRKGIETCFTGIDIKDTCIQYAKENTQHLHNTNFICADYRDAVLSEKPDIIFSSLFCHHFTDEDVKNIIEWKYRNAKIGFFINDLQRHPLAFHSIRILSNMFSSSYLVKNDAPLSVQRGFSKDDWFRIMSSANIPGLRASIKWKWAFRWLITVSKDQIPGSGSSNLYNE